MRRSEISIIIPTKDRPDDLRRCLESIISQREILPKELIVVDASTKGLIDLDRFRKAPFPVVRIESEPGLTKQRNIGISKAAGDIIAFLDDDCVIPDNYCESLEAAYRLVPDAGGMQGIMINSRERTFLKKLFTTVFFLTEIDGVGKMKPSGVPSFLDKHLCLKHGKPLRTDVLSGYGASYKKSVFEDGFLFNESLKGYCLGEDYEFSYRVSRKFCLYVTPSVRLHHFESPVSRDIRDYYYQRIVNVYKYWKEFGFNAYFRNYFAFGLYVIGNLLQALRDCIKNKGLAALAGWHTGVSDILSSGSEEAAPFWSKEAVVVIVAAFLCGVGLILNSYTPLLLLGLIWLILYLIKRGFIKGILFLLVIYMPFDSFILSHIPASAFLYCKYLSTGVIFVISAIIILQGYGRLYLLGSIPGISFVVLYVIVGFISALINSVSPLLTITALQQELRYIPLFMALAVTSFDTGYVRHILKAIIWVGLINVAIGLIQLCAGKFVTPFLLQNAVIVEGEIMAISTAQVLQKAGLIFGVFPSYNVFGAYLTIIFLLFAAFNRYKIFTNPILPKLEILIFIVLLFTLSRSSIMGAIIGYIIILLVSRSKKSVPMFLIFVCAVSLIFIIGYEAKIYSPNPQELPFMPRILEAFSPEGWRTSALYGRNALMSLTLKTLTDSHNLTFGLGPGNWGGLLAWKYSAFYNSILGSSAASALDKTILADVNWASILGQFGIAGTLSFTLFIASIIRYSQRILNASRAADPLLKVLALAVFGILTAIILESFFGSWFATRPIAFYIWLLAGFMVSLNNHEKA